jgi:hypothetical protein
MAREEHSCARQPTSKGGVGGLREVDVADQDRERWTKLVAGFETSELTQREFASERGNSFSNLRNWLYKLRKKTRPLVGCARCAC